MVTKTCRACGQPMTVVEVGRAEHPCCDPSFIPGPSSVWEGGAAIQHWNELARERDRTGSGPTATAWREAAAARVKESEAL